MNAILFTKQVGGLDLIKERNRYYKGYSGAGNNTISVQKAVGKRVKHYILPTTTHIKAIGEDSARVLIGFSPKLKTNTDKGFKPYDGPLADAGTDYYFEYEKTEFVPYRHFKACYNGDLNEVYAKKNDHYIK